MIQLMLHRTKKKNDINKDKWLGIGGNFVEKLQNDSRFFTVKFEYDGDKLIKYNLKEY